MINILFVTDDAVAVQFLGPICQRLAVSERHQLRILAEGTSFNEWLRFGPPSLTASENFFRSLELLSESLIRDRRQPKGWADCVITGLSRQANLEDEASKLANRHGIPLVWYEHISGTQKHFKAKPNLVLGTDVRSEDACKAILELLPHI